MSCNLFGNHQGNIKDTLKNAQLYKKHVDDIKIDNDKLKKELEEAKEEFNNIKEELRIEVNELKKEVKEQLEEINEDIKEKIESLKDIDLSGYATLENLEMNIKQITDAVEEYILSTNTPRDIKDTRYADLKDMVRKMEDKLEKIEKLGGKPDRSSSVERPKIAIAKKFIQK